MKTHDFRKGIAISLVSSLAILASGAARADATINIVNANLPGVGFNDPTPVAPVGGNIGTTLGEQRLIAFRHGAALWGARLDSNVAINVSATFEPLAPNVLGSAGAIDTFKDFPGSTRLYPGVEFAETWYGSALANKRAGADLDPAKEEIRARFSTNFNFYLGLDNNHGAQVDLVAVVLHELGHGLNFQTFVSSATGQNVDAPEGNPNGGHTDIYARYLVDSTNELHWNEMTAAQRQASAIKFGRLVWDGPNVFADLPDVLQLGSPEVRVTAPPAIAGPYQFGSAAFGPPVGSPNVVGNVVAAVDAAEPGGTTTDGCSPFSNAAVVAGSIVLIERGFCGFAVKARNATNAGAIAAVIYNQAANVNAAPPGMADDGINGAFVTIPTVSLTRADGLAIVGQLGGGVAMSIGVDPAIRAGADSRERARLYAPFPVVGGSSVSHYDTVAFPNLLMEPAINGDLTHNLEAPSDLTHELLLDVGWFPDADLDGLADNLDSCPNSNLAPTIVIGGSNSGVPNGLFNTGCTMSDLIAQAADAANNHGRFVSAVDALTTQWKKAGLITGKQKDAIMSAASKANIP